MAPWSWGLHPAAKDPTRYGWGTLFSTPTFDVHTIDVATLTLEGASVRLVRGKGLMASFEDVNQGGLLDLVVHFDRGELQLNAGDTTATLTGATVGGVKIEGSDSVKVIE